MTHAVSANQHVQGKFNADDTEGRYAHIVGNGTDGYRRSNIHTVGWDGSAWFKGKVYVGGTSQDDAEELGVGQTDWNAQEGEAGYVQNRTHYKIDGQLETLIPETTAIAIDADNGQFGVAEQQTFPELGATYTVNWNGTTYELEAVGVDGDGLTAAGFGNVGALTGGASTGEPFLILVIPAEAYEVTQAGALIWALDGSTEVTFSIYRDATVIKKLDYDFMPKGYPAVKVTEGTLLPQTEVISVGSGMGTMTPLAGELIVGKTYTVNLNGTEVQTTAKLWRSADLGVTLKILGNAGLDGSGEDTGEEFLIAVLTPEVKPLFGGAELAVMGGLTIGGDNYLSITGEMEVVTEMDERFVKTAIANGTKNFIDVKTEDGSPFVKATGNVPMFYDQMGDGNFIVVPVDVRSLMGFAFGDYLPNGALLCQMNGVWVAIPHTVLKIRESDGVRYVDGIQLYSTTEGSQKRFILSVDDTGTISATEVS